MVLPDPVGDLKMILELVELFNNSFVFSINLLIALI